MATKKEIRSDIILQLTQGAPSNDFNLPNRQIDFWIGYYRNSLVATELNEKLKRGEPIPSVYITSQTGIELQEAGDNFTLPISGDVMILNKNAGIIKIEDEDGNEIKKSDPQSLTLFKRMRFAKPSVDNVLYSFEGSSIILHTLSDSDISLEDYSVWYVAKQDVLNMADSETIQVSDLTLPMLIETCVQQGKLELYGTEADKESDGVDYKSQKYHLGISNPVQQ
jgi:hypothetical protein